MLTNALPHRRALLMLCLGALVSTVPLTGCGTGINLVSEDEEWQMGRQIEQDINRQVRLVNDATIQNYVNQMGQRIVAQTPLANRQWRFHVVQSSEVNAFNAPGGLVYIYTGLIARTENAAELAGVVAHEIAHGAARHGTQRLTQVYGLNVAAAIILGSDPGLVSQVAAQIIGGGAIASFSRGQEIEADRLGVRFMAAAGYNPEGMATMFEKLIADRQRQPGAVERFFSTHPLTEDRIATVRREARSVQRGNLITNDGQFANVRTRAARY
jgi:beta-barrel assembly-enhancing protease